MPENKITYAEYTEQLKASTGHPDIVAPDILRVDLETVPVEKKCLVKIMQDDERARRQTWQGMRHF